MSVNKETLQKFLYEKFPNSKIMFVGEGWESLAFIVDDKIIRFPKKDMDDYKKEQKITDFIRDKIDFQIPKITILEDVEYPYAIHKMLIGNDWTFEKIINRPPEMQKNFIHDCAKFFNSVHKIDKNQIDQKFPGLLKTRKSEVESFEYINKNLQKFLSNKEIREIYKKYEKATSHAYDDIVLLHRDFSGGNSLISNDLHLIGVFDWGDVNFGDRAYEFQKFYDPKYMNLLKDILYEYKLLSGVHIDIEKVKDISLIDRTNCVCWANNSDSLGDIKEKELDRLVKKLKYFL